MAVRVHLGHQRELDELQDHIGRIQEHDVSGEQPEHPAMAATESKSSKDAIPDLRNHVFNDVLSDFAKDHDVAWVPRAVVPAHRHRPLNGGEDNLPEGINPCGSMTGNGSRPGWMLPAAVHRKVPKSRWSEPKAKAALDKEWNKLLNAPWPDGKGNGVWGTSQPMQIPLGKYLEHQQDIAKLKERLGNLQQQKGTPQLWN